MVFLWLRNHIFIADAFNLYTCIGGIVTFTPQALFDDPIGVQHRISQIHSHPMWECYILPSVLGMTAKMYCQNEEKDPIADLDR